MENIATTAQKDWRQAWRAFADRVSRYGDDSDSEARRAPQPERLEGRDEPFTGFGSPEGKF